jgi:hypothetical protein
MTAPVTILAATNVRSEAATVLASLPLSYAPGARVEGGVAVVGGSADWPGVTARALDAGAVAVIVVHPEPAEVGVLRAATAVVALDTRWAPNPVVASAATAFTTALPRGSRIECQVQLPVGSSLEAALLDQLILVRAVVGGVSDVRILTRSRHGYAAEGVAAGHPIDLSLVCTDAVPENASVRLLTSDGSVVLNLPSGATAQPARLTVTGPDGALLAPTVYESGHRATWRRVRTLLAAQSTTTDDLDNFASDAETVRTASLSVDG